MEIQEIRKAWAIKERDIQSEVQMWDSQSDDPTYSHVYDKFIELLEQKHMLDKSFEVLDVGCGVGIYSIALSEKVHSVTGMDISPKMLANGKKIIEESEIKNVSLEPADWNTVDLESRGMKGRYDLVFAHNTPAICDYNTFEKLNDASRRFCAVCNPIRMIEPVMQKINEMAGVGEGDSCDSNFSYMLDLLLHKGLMPKISYERQAWPMNQSYEDACAFYLNRVRMLKELSESETAEIEEYLKSLLKDGIISDQIDTTVATIYWEK